MELHGLLKSSHHSCLGEEKQQMLNLNRRLETYLNRVKLLEEENALLAKEIQALRRGRHGASTRKKGLEEELRQTRLELDAAWRDRVHTELEVGRLTEEFQALDLQRQREAQAHIKAKTIVDQSRKELEGEQRAQIWLREKVNHLEHEMRLLIQTHQEDVAHLEATLTQSRASRPPTLAQRSNQPPSLLQLGQEYSQRVTRAWQEATEAYQGQLLQLEEALNQARGRLSLVDQEKRESQLRLQALEKEITSAQDVRMHLEKSAAQKRDTHSQEIQQLQAHLEGLEVEREEVGHHIDCVLQENRGLLQLKMSLGLEVATYRALLDSESLRGGVSLLNQPRNISITDVAFCPQAVRTNYQTQPSATHNTTSLSSLRAIAGTAPTALDATHIFNRKPAEADAFKSATWETPYPKILQDGAVENFRPQEVHEKVTYAEPLSPPNEQESFTQTSTGANESEEDQRGDDDETPEEPVLRNQIESGLSSEPLFKDEVIHHQFTTPNLTPSHTSMSAQACVFPDESDSDMPTEGPTETDDVQELHAPIEAWGSEESIGKTAEHVQEETDSETEAVLEPAFESRTSSPMSECENAEPEFIQFTDFSQGGSSSFGDTSEIPQKLNSSVVGANETDVEDKLYPDGEEMDTWDSVIERKVDLKTDDDIKEDEEKRQCAEPEEDISAREPELEKREDLVTDVEAEDYLVMETKEDDDGDHAALYQEDVPPPDKEEEKDDEEEDSQNVCVSWRTELESDSYAQDNTLADTRPLIRYKSDETDANTQASHMDESESSEGDQEKKMAEMGSATWTEEKSKKFGTMEDLCEEVEGEALDEEYDLGYAHTEEREVVIEHATSLNDRESVKDMRNKDSDRYSYDETEELSKPTVSTNADYDEEIDRLVEQELEDLSTESYSAHFAQQQATECEDTLHLQSEQEEDGQIKTEDMSLCAESGPSLQSPNTTRDQPPENPEVMPQTHTLAHEVEQEHAGAQAKREEGDEQNVSMVTNADVAEDCAGFGDLIGRPETDDLNNPEEQDSVAQEDLQVAAAPAELEDIAPTEVTDLQEHQGEDATDCQTGTDEREVLENPSEDLQIRHDRTCDDGPESYLHDDGSFAEGALMCKEEAHEISPDSVPDEHDIFVVKDSTESMNKNSKDSSLHGVFNSSLMSDFWASSLETGATYQTDDARDEAEQPNQDVGFRDNIFWGDSGNPHVINGNSRVDTDSSNAPTTKEERVQMHSEVKQLLCRNVVEGELVHSEESEVEAESWSSGEETV